MRYVSPVNIFISLVNIFILRSRIYSLGSLISFNIYYTYDKINSTVTIYMKKTFAGDIEKITLKNNNYRKVLFTSKRMQLVVMSIKPREDIGSEVHKTIDQFIRIEKGAGIAILGTKKYKLKDGAAVIIPAGVKHNIINTSKTNALKLYTIYSPPNHPVDTIQKNKPVGED